MIDYVDRVQCKKVTKACPGYTLKREKAAKRFNFTLSSEFDNDQPCHSGQLISVVTSLNKRALASAMLFLTGDTDPSMEFSSGGN